MKNPPDFEDDFPAVRKLVFGYRFGGQAALRRCSIPDSSYRRRGFLSSSFLESGKFFVEIDYPPEKTPDIPIRQRGQAGFCNRFVLVIPDGVFYNEIPGIWKME